ncbi:MAG TPA: AraC family ligand binding domain-containing protein, partial [Myxococcota bacterium]|nr:AraC family ligand binding domain-containing protein [Myxococcota bacterium]
MIDPDRVPAATFALEDQLAPGPGAWHVHQRHQLLYARDGTLHLEVEDASWMLPPQRAAWIDGGARHRVRLGRPATLNTVYLDPSVAPALGFGCRVFAVGELAVTMLRASVRWGPERDPADPLADAWFAALAGLAREWAGAAMQTRLPRPKSAGLVRGFDHLL